MANTDPIVFKDMAEREDAERERLKARKFALEQAKQRQGGKLHPDLQKELNKISQHLNLPKGQGPKAVVDPLFNAIQQWLKDNNQTVADHVDGKLPSQIPPAAGAGPLGLSVMKNEEKALAAIFGILLREGETEPFVHLELDPRNPNELIAVPDPNRPDQYRRFSEEMARALGEFNANRQLFDAVLEVLINEGNKTKQDFVRAEHLAAVTKMLAEQGVPAGDMYLQRQVVVALSGLLGGTDGLPSNIVIDLPDLEAVADVEIVAENLHAMQAIFFSMTLEDLRVFQVVDKLAEQFQMGMLPFGRGTAGDILYKYWKRSADRISEVERRNLYARAYGYSGGDAGNPNREFSDLWLRFVSAVSTYVRQSNVDNLLRSALPSAVSQEQVRKAGRDLAANLSLHGYGISYFVAGELQNQIKEFIDLLSHKDVKNAYGARDMWQVIDQVATLELGGARNSVRYRTMASAGAVIIRWLANHATRLAGASYANILDISLIQNPPPRLPGQKPTTHPNDADLVGACEQWLAVTGTSDQRVEEFSQPVEGPNQTSRPIQIPSIAKDLLDSVGISAGLSSNGHPKNGYVNGHAYR
jgi:hypothetical protein